MRRRVTPFGCVLAATAVVLYGFLLTRGTFDPFGAEPLGLTFNSMLGHLLAGRWDVDPAVIGQEAFVRDGRSYAYFGPFPAMLRLPLLIVPAWQTLHVERLSCLLAVSIGLAAQAAIIMGCFARASGCVRDALAPIVLITSVISGPALLLGIKGALIYHEAILWAWALAMLFIATALRGLRQEMLPTSSLYLMSALAGVCLLTRSTTGAGLMVAIGLIVAREALATPRRARWWGNGLLLSGFVAVAAVVNDGRWGKAWCFGDLRLQAYMIAAYPDRLERLHRYGLFNIHRVWFGLLYYFVPVCNGRIDRLLALHRSLHDLFDALERPASSLFLTDPMWCAFALYGAALVARRRARISAPVLIGVSIAPLLMLVAWYMAFRYRVEFTPLLMTVAAAGLGHWATRVRDEEIARARMALFCLAGLQVTGATIAALRYAAAAFGPSAGFSAIGITAG